MMKRLKIIVIMYAVVAAVAVSRVSSAQQSFAVEPEDLSAVVDTTVSLPCRVADLAGQLQWTKDDFALGTNRNLSYHGYPRYAMTGSDGNGKYLTCFGRYRVYLKFVYFIYLSNRYIYKLIIRIAVAKCEL